MRTRNLSILFAVIAAVVCLAPNAKADSSLTLTGVGNGLVAGGVYVGPYQGTVNGTATPIICDDYADESYDPEAWMATATNVASITSTTTGLRFSGANNVTGVSTQVAYDAAAYITNLLLGVSTTDTLDQTIDQFALWQLFTPGADASLSATLQGDINTLIAEAETPAYYDSIDLADFVVYTPDTNAMTPQCGSGPCPSSPPQEFIVRAAEPSTLLLLAVGFGFLIFLGVRRKREQGSLIAA